MVACVLLAHIGHCSECETGQCGLERHVKSCALCDDYPCPTISGFLDQVPPARANIETLRRTRQ